MPRLAPGILLAIVVLCAAWPAAAQRGPVYCNVTDIKSEQLSNGVQVRIEADGQLQWDIDWEQLIEQGAVVEREEEWGMSWDVTEKFRRLPISIWNARSKLGSAFIPIDKYPVSHAEISIPEWAHEGVGLEIRVVNYLGWVTGEGELERYRYDMDTDSTEDGNGILITWESDRFPPPPRPETPEDLPEELTVVCEGGELSVRAVNARLAAVANAISREAGFPVAAPSDADLRVSLVLDDVTPEQALQMTAMGSGLCASACPDGGWTVAEPRAGGGYGASVTRRIPLRYLRALDALGLLPTFLLEYVHADEEANAMVATGPAWMVDRVAEDLSKLDTPPPEVLLEVVAVEYTSAETLSRNLRLERFAGDFAAGLDSLTGGLGFLWLEGLPEGWDMLLDNLEVEATTELRSRATLRVLNGHQAYIAAGQERYMVLEGLGLEAYLERIGTGTTLSVQPLVGDGKEVLLHFGLVVRSLRGTDPTSGLPILALRRANGMTRVREGETIVLAGLHLKKESRQDRALPVLGWLPLIGQFFRAPDRSQSEAQLAFFVTPHILRDSLPAEGESHHG